MKTLVVYFSRTGHTRTVARGIAEALGAELDEIRDRTNRRGIFGYLRSGREAWFRRRVELIPASLDPAEFDLVVIGTPIWNMSLSSPVRTFLAEHATALRSVAFFCTMGGMGSDRVFRQMQEVCGKPPLATFAQTERELASPALTAAIGAFASRLRAASTSPPPSTPRPVDTDHAHHPK